MASSINASTSGGGGVIVSSDATGNLNIQSGGSTVVAVTSAGVAVTGTLSATGAITGSSTVAGSTGILYPLTSGTAVATTSGTSIDFTSIPSWVKRITVMFSEVSTNGTSNLQVQVGNGSIVTTGYSGSCASGATVAANVSAFIFTVNIGAASTVSGVAVIQSLNGLTYCQLGNSGGNAGNIVASSGGAVTLSSVLDRVRITTVNGTDTFDAGSINILYE